MIFFNKWVSFTISIVGIALVRHGSEANYNFTYSMAAKCKEHISRSGYRYDTYYTIDENAYKNRKPASSEGLSLEMHIAILAPRDGHIMLSTHADPKSTDAVYEIVIGGGSNSFSELRRMRQKYAKHSVRSKDILSPIEYRAFWIKIFIDGVIEFGKEGEEVAVLTYMDPDPIKVNVFSFAAWDGVEAKFLYDCPTAGDMNDESNSTMVEEPPATASLRLRREILAQSLRSLAPVGENGSRITVTMLTKILAINFDVINSQLDVMMAFIMVWQDINISWNASEYEDIRGIIFQNSELWSPQLMVFNGIGFGMIDPGTKAPLYVTQSGHVSQIFTTNFKAICDAGEGITRWPRDEHECTLKIGPYGSLHQLILVVAELDMMESEKKNSSMLSDIDAEIDNDLFKRSYGWEILKMTQHTEWYNDSPFHKLDAKVEMLDPDDKSDTKLIVSLRIKRKDYSTTVLVYTPVFVMLFFSLATCWISHDDKLVKGWSCLAQIPIASSLLCAIAGQIPFISDGIPDVAFFYSCVIFSALVHWMLYIARDHAQCRHLVATRRVSNVIKWNPLRTVLCLPNVKDDDQYNYLKDCSTSAPDDSEGDPIVELNSDDSEEKRLYSDFILATNRIIFSAFFIFYTVLLFYHC